MLGAVGLVLPALLDVATVLVPLPRPESPP
jgi:hypothetical protein